MSLVGQVARIFLLAAVICGTIRAGAHPSGSSQAIESHGDEPAAVQAAPKIKLEDRATQPRVGLLNPSLAARGQEGLTLFSEPFAAQAMATLPSEVSEVSVKWAELQSRILAEGSVLATCRSGDGPCPAAARRFLSIVELGRLRQGRTRLGEINRAVNLSIKPVSDWTQYGVDDYWSAPLATLRIGAGDCEDYAILKYVALRESGVVPDDLRLVIVRDIKHRTTHAVVAVHYDDTWLILDNRTLVMVNAEEARHYYPLFVLDHRGVRTFATAIVRR